MPVKKTAARGTRAAPADERKIAMLRSKYLAQIAGLEPREAGAPLIVKAQELMKSRYWANASWRERGKILDTVAWLLKAQSGAKDRKTTK